MCQTLGTRNDDLVVPEEDGGRVQPHQWLESSFTYKRNNNRNLDFVSSGKFVT